MTASLDLSSSGVRHSKERIAQSAAGFPDDRTARCRREPRARPEACEGPKRTTTRSEPDKLPLIGGNVLNKTAALRPEGVQTPAHQTYEL